jgi:hypothetical protein
MRLFGFALLIALATSPRGQAQADALGDTATGGSGPCTELNTRAIEATMVIRRHASVLSTGIEAEAKAQGMIALARRDQWAGRLRGLVDVADVAACLGDGDMETYRRALATATRVANTTREELLRPARAAIQQQLPQRRRF